MALCKHEHLIYMQNNGLNQSKTKPVASLLSGVSYISFALHSISCTSPVFPQESCHSWDPLCPAEKRWKKQSCLTYPAPTLVPDSARIVLDTTMESQLQLYASCISPRESPISFWLLFPDSSFFSLVF